MTRTLCLVTALLLSLGAMAGENAKVMLFGTFHFKDAGLDVAKVEDLDIFTPGNQAALDALTSRLAAWPPTAVLLEYDAANDETINERYRAYLKDKYELPANEIYQLGFRIARKAGLDRVHSFDHREVEWQAEALFAYAEQHQSPELAAFQAQIAEFTEQETLARRTQPLLQLLANHNDPERDQLNRDLYLVTNVVGVDDGWAGADAAASWWHRNFRMYARIQREAIPGARVLAIGGSGHTAILKQFVVTDRRIESVDVRPYIEASAD